MMYSKSEYYLSIHLNNNQLISLDLTNNLLLRYLYLSNNQLTSFDASFLVDLQGLGINQNQLISLDLSNNTNLRNLTIQNNQLIIGYVIIVIFKILILIAM